MSENKIKLGQEPAFPSEPKEVVIGQTSYNVIDENGKQQIMYQNQFGKELQNGMSKRFYAACCAMQGLIAVGYTSEELIAKQAFIQADILLQEEYAE